MSTFVFFLIPVALIVTLVVLGLGIYSLAKGGVFAKENSNKLMRFRVLAQGIAIALMALFLMLIGKGPGA
ncbi:MAG: twin transmembrane helix small protein [Pseudomonadota bacterium]